MSAENRLVVAVDDDPGTDPDGFSTIAYLAGLSNVEIAAYSTGYAIPDKRAEWALRILRHVGLGHVAVGAGAVFPSTIAGNPEQERDFLRQYDMGHRLYGAQYEGVGMPESNPHAAGTVFRSAEDVLIEAIDRHGKNLHILAIQPMANIANLGRAGIGKVGGIHVQGQATVEDGRLKPNFIAYNLRQDPAASSLVFQWAQEEGVPLYVTGQEAAKRVPLDRDFYRGLAVSGNPIAPWLFQDAQNCLLSFAERHPESFHRLYGADADPRTMPILSQPYDVLAAMTIAGIAHPDLRQRLRLQFETVTVDGVTHMLLGNSEVTHGVPEPVLVRQHLGSTILQGLSRTGR